IEHTDGAREHVWDLQDVDNLGRSLHFDTTIGNLELGERRAVAREAFLVFRNTYVEEDIRLPLTVPVVEAVDTVNLDVVTDHATYPADSQVTGTVTLQNPHPETVAGILQVTV